MMFKNNIQNLNPLEKNLTIRLKSQENIQNCELERMVKIQDIYNAYLNLVLQLADIEFKRILTVLNLPESLKSDCVAIFKKIWKNMKKGSKARIPNKLAPVVVYMFLKVKTILFDREDLLKTVKNREDFKEVLSDACLYYQAYLKSDRKIQIETISHIFPRRIY